MNNMIYCTPIPCELPEKKERLPEEVVNKAAMFFYLKPEQVKSKIRKREYVEARNFIIKYLTDTTRLTLTAIGKVLSRDHSSVLHARERFKDHLHTEHITRERYDSFLEYLKR